MAAVRLLAGVVHTPGKHDEGKVDLECGRLFLDEANSDPCPGINFHHSTCFSIALFLALENSLVRLMDSTKTYYLGLQSDKATPILKKSRNKNAIRSGMFLFMYVNPDKCKHSLFSNFN